MNSGTERQAQQRAAIIKEYNDAIEDGVITLAERIRNNPDHGDIFLNPYIFAGEKVEL